MLFGNDMQSRFGFPGASREACRKAMLMARIHIIVIMIVAVTLILHIYIYIERERCNNTDTSYDSREACRKARLSASRLARSSPTNCSPPSESVI